MDQYNYTGYGWLVGLPHSHTLKALKAAGVSLPTLESNLVMYPTPPIPSLCTRAPCRTEFSVVDIDGPKRAKRN